LKILRKWYKCNNCQLFRSAVSKILCLDTVLYGMEGWTVKVSTTSKLEAFEMWVYRRVLRIPWTARRTNDDVLRIINRP